MLRAFVDVTNGCLVEPFFKPCKNDCSPTANHSFPKRPSDNCRSKQGINIASHLCITNIAWGQDMTVSRLRSKYIILYGRARY
jgi:hypothetical protein